MRSPAEFAEEFAKEVVHEVCDFFLVKDTTVVLAPAFACNGRSGAPQSVALGIYTRLLREDADRPRNNVQRRVRDGVCTNVFVCATKHSQVHHKHRAG